VARDNDNNNNNNNNFTGFSCFIISNTNVHIPVLLLHHTPNNIETRIALSI